MTSLRKAVLSILATAMFAVPATSFAITHAYEVFPSEAVVIDARDFDTAFPSTSPTVKIVANRSADGEKPDANNQSRILFTLPGDVFSVPAERISRALVVFSRTYDKNYDGRALSLHPLSAPFSLSNTTWNVRDAETPWSAPGGDFLDASVSAVYDDSSATIAWDIAPLLADPAAAAALRDNGAIVCFDTNKVMEVKFMQLTFASPAYTDDPSLLPSLRYALVDSFEDDRDFAVSYIDSRNATTVFWEQAKATVGKVILNGMDGSECRAILTMPESLAAMPPSRVQSVVAKFDAEIRDYEGEDIFLAPLATKTWLERHPNNETSPVHGPSWTWADGAVDTNATSFVVDETTYDNAAWETPGGDWMADFMIQGTVTPPAKGTTGTAEFDLTKLWHDDDARENLIKNGAIVFLDPEAFDQAKEDKRMARVNLYRPDDAVTNEYKYSWVRVTEYEQFAGGEDVTPLTAFRIDSRDSDTSFFGDKSAKIVLNFKDNPTSETRAFCTLPEDALDEDLPALDGYFLRFNGGCRDDGDMIPVLLSAVTRPFGTTDELRTTWNSAWTNTETGEAEAWATPGGDIDASFSVTGTYDTASGDLTFDLSALQKNDDAAVLALANGLVMRFDPDQTAVDPESGAMPRITIGAAGQIVKVRKTVASTYIDSQYPDDNFGDIDRNPKARTVVTLNNAASGNEARALLKLAPELLDVDLRSAGSVNLLVSYFKCWPGDDGVNPVALHPVTTPFRLDEATWNKASDNMPWETAGGDFLDAHVVASDSPSQSVLAFDLAPLLANAESAKALAENGAIVRMLGEPPVESSNNGYNMNGSLSASVPVIVFVPSNLELELAMDSIAPDAESGLIRCTVVGFAPLESQRYEVWGTSSLVPVEDDPATQWHRLGRLSFDGTFTVSPADPERFFRVQPVQ